MGTDAASFRDLAKQKLVAAFGSPRALKSESGDLYRWVLERTSGLHVHLYITLDSPELPEIAHVLISDPGSRAVSPITSVTMRTLPEVESLIEQIRARLRD